MADNMFQDITVEELNPSIWYCSRVHDSRNEQVHHHSNNIELAFILSGNGRYMVNSKEYDVHQGDLVICNPGDEHQNIIIDRDNPTIEFICGFSDVHFAGMGRNRIELQDGSAILRFSPEHRREISRCCYDIIEENDRAEPGRYYIIKALVIRILVLIFRAIQGDVKNDFQGTSFSSYSKSYVTRKIIDFLNENYDQRISLDQIATNMYLSPVYISKIFKEKTGDSPINYLIRIRLEKAKEMLDSDSTKSIREIAQKVGYEDMYHFSKLFKRHFGISPLAYRRQ